MAKPDYIEGSGNVFADLGLPNADELLAKAELAIRITEILRRRCLTQVQAAKILGVDQPKVSALIRGRIAGFSIERLLRFLLLLGANVSITIQPRPRSRVRPHKTTAKHSPKLPRLGVITVSEIGSAKSAKNLRAL
jgi:predicted XRE-type DNA-binding protein